MSEVDQIAEWAAAQQRVIELVENLDADAAARRVPATPDWTVHDLLAHMVGLGVDTMAGNEPDDHNPAWTQQHVDDRRDASITDIVAEWRGITEPLQEWMQANNPRPMGDVVIHEQDLRGALGVSGGQHAPAHALLRDLFATRVADAVAAKELEPLRLEGDTWVFGPDNAEVVIAAPDFELTRMLLSRRSANQVRAWTRQGDVEPYLDCLAVLGPLPDDDRTE